MNSNEQVSPAPAAEGEISAPTPDPKKSRTRPDASEWRPHRRSYAANSRVYLSYHRRKCSVCKHPMCSSIEAAFLRWQSPRWIAKEFGLYDRQAIYCHANVLGLFAERNRNLRFALGHIIERAECVNPTADSVVHAVRAFAHLSDDGQWIEPPTTHVVIARIEPPRPPERSAQLPRPDASPTPLPTQPAASYDRAPHESLPALVSGVESAHADPYTPKSGHELTS